MSKAAKKEPSEAPAPVHATKQVLEARINDVVIDARYALDQLTQHRDSKRAIDALQRILENLKEILRE